MEAATGFLLISRELLVLERLKTNTILTNSDDDYASALRAARLVVLVREGDADLGDGGRGCGWAVDHGGLLVVDIDAGGAAVGCGCDCQAAVIGDWAVVRLVVGWELLASDGAGAADLADGEEGTCEEKGDEDEDHEGDQEVEHGS